MIGDSSPDNTMLRLKMAGKKSIIIVEKKHEQTLDDGKKRIFAQ
jgi:hypothetical protein